MSATAAQSPDTSVRGTPRDPWISNCISHRRAYLQALIDQQMWNMRDIDNFADELAADHWNGAHVPREEAGGLLVAFMRGFDAGYNAGHKDGYDAGEEDAKLTTT